MVFASVLIGYARVSAQDLTLKQQMDALGRAGCERIFLDKAGCGQADREGLADAISHLRRGDELVVFKLDRLGRTVRQLIKLVDELRQRDIGLEVWPTALTRLWRTAGRSCRRWPLFLKWNAPSFVNEPRSPLPWQKREAGRVGGVRN